MGGAPGAERMPPNLLPRFIARFSSDDEDGSRPTGEGCSYSVFHNREAGWSECQRVGSAVSVATYAVIAWLVWRAVGQPDDWWIWVLTAYFTLGIVLNAASRSRPERLVMTPIVSLLAVCCLLIALA